MKLLTILFLSFCGLSTFAQLEEFPGAAADTTFDQETRQLKLTYNDASGTTFGQRIVGNS